MLQTIRRINWLLIGAVLFSLLTWFVVLFWSTMVYATECPDPGVKCKVLFLNDQEEQMLMTRNGILDTAAQGRALELGQFSVYLKQKIAAAAAGEVKQVPQPAEKNPPAPVDKPAQ